MVWCPGQQSSKWLVQELMSHDLENVLKSRNVLKEFTRYDSADNSPINEYRFAEWFLEVVKKVASALRHIHSLGFVHLDLKPDNVLLAASTVRRSPQVKLADFGCAIDLGTSQRVHIPHRRGTPLYMAPEVFEAGAPSRQHRRQPLGGFVERAADVFSFSLLVWRTFTREIPFDSCDHGGTCRGVNGAQGTGGWDVNGCCSKCGGFCGTDADRQRDGLRPDATKLPQYLRVLLQQCWDKSPLNRPSFDQIWLDDISAQDLCPQMMTTDLPSTPSSTTGDSKSKRSRVNSASNKSCVVPSSKRWLAVGNEDDNQASSSPEDVLPQSTTSESDSDHTSGSDRTSGIEHVRDALHETKTSNIGKYHVGQYVPRLYGVVFQIVPDTPGARGGPGLLKIKYDTVASMPRSLAPASGNVLQGVIGDGHKRKRFLAVFCNPVVGHLPASNFEAAEVARALGVGYVQPTGRCSLKDLRDALKFFRPHVLWFAGHVDSTRGHAPTIVLTDSHGRAQLHDAQRIVSVIAEQIYSRSPATAKGKMARARKGKSNANAGSRGGGAQPSLQCVVLNACHSVGAENRVGDMLQVCGCR
jgi:serine/threonine protein kinase